MNVQFNQDVKLSTGELVAKLMDVGSVIAEDNDVLQIRLERPINPAYPILSVPKSMVWMPEQKSEIAMSIDNNVYHQLNNKSVVDEPNLGFRVRSVGIKDIDLRDYLTFRTECSSLDGVTVPIAITKALDAANIAGKLMEYRALLLYTSTELERQTKLKYSLAVGKAEGSSQDKREALAKQDPEYQALLMKAAEIGALKQLVDDAFEHANKLHYFFKVIYQGESRVPMDTPFRG